MKDKINKVELLAPAGSYEKMVTAFHFGADAVYLAGKQYGLRAFADNFSIEEMQQAVEYAHSKGKKVYVTLNIFANNSDFEQLQQYLKQLENIKVDAVLVSDVGMFDFVRTHSKLNIHISTQANTTNKYAVDFWIKQGAERVVLAREVALEQIKEIKEYVPKANIECFVHGAMCISYSGRCLMSNYMTQRDSNRGECVQACRWKWQIKEYSRTDDDAMPVYEDERGTYIFNSKDLNMLPHIDKLISAGVDSLKIEGRMKSPFYVATVVNAYRRAIDSYYQQPNKYIVDEQLLNELNKASHRSYTTGFYLDENQQRQYYKSSRAVEESKFIAKVLSYHDGIATIEQRNKFVAGDTLEILSNGDSFNKQFVANNITDNNGNTVEVCNRVQQILHLPCPHPLNEGDILRYPQQKQLEE